MAVNVEDELYKERQEALEKQNQQERLQALEAQQEEQEQNSPYNQVREAVKQQAKNALKNYGKEYVVESVAAATAPIWGPILAILGFLAGIVVLVMLVFVLLTAACNQSGLTGALARSVSFVASYLPGISADVCKQLAMNPGTTGGASGGGGASGSFATTLTTIPKQYVKLSAFGAAKFDYPKLKPAFEAMIESIMSQAQAQGLAVHITSGLRQPGGPENYSCHYLGEAADIDFDNAIPIGANQTPANAAKIDALVALAKNSGAGYVQDEYRHPSAGATAGHVHLSLGSDPNCNGRQGEVAQYANEYTMPY